MSQTCIITQYRTAKFVYTRGVNLPMFYLGYWEISYGHFIKFQNFEWSGYACFGACFEHGCVRVNPHMICIIWCILFLFSLSAVMLKQWDQYPGEKLAQNSGSGTGITILYIWFNTACDVTYCCVMFKSYIISLH